MTGNIQRSAVLDVLDELVFVFEADGTLLEWNRATAETSGYPDEALATMTPDDLFVGAGLERELETTGVDRSANGAPVEGVLVTDDGDHLPYEFEVRRLSDGGESTFVGIGREVGERRAVESDRAVLDRMSDAFFAVDTEWCITHVNEAGARILREAMEGEPDGEDLEGLHLWAEIPDAVDTIFYGKYHEAMETQEPVAFEEYYDALDTWFDVRAYPSETGLSVYFYDVTERHRQREDLERRERVLRRMHGTIADRQQPFTEQVEALLAMGRAELGVAYGTLSEIRGDDYVFEVVEAADDGIQAGDVVPVGATNCEIAASTEQTLVLGDVARDAPGETDRAGYTEWGISCYIGAPVYVDDEVYGTFCFYDTEPRDGQFSEWEVTLVDLMSRWVSYELERQQANERLQRQNEKLAEFGAMVSHDLRNPLNVLSGSLDLAEETGDAAEFERARRAIERMDTLIDDMLSLARAGATIDETEPVDVDALGRECWRNVATADATLQVELERPVRADRTRLQQLLENLFRNSVEHGSTSSRPEADDAVEHGSTSPRSQAHEDSVEHGGETVTVTVGELDDGFYVADDGPGIPADERDDVLERGYSTGRGTGFGLAIVREIAEAHGWSVDVTESEEGGARFEFTGVDR